ncbi:MAG: PqqD family protein [Clostridia bacterium]|nr:PqqD family protein [Clostridia bacterium]
MKTKSNFLEKVPVRNVSEWTADEKGIVTLNIHNKGLFNKIAQTLFKKPKISYVHLDEMGSFIWPLIDGKINIINIGKAVEEHFGEKANPLYERLAKYLKILESYNFIKFV